MFTQLTSYLSSKLPKKKKLLCGLCHLGQETWCGTIPKCCFLGWVRWPFCCSIGGRFTQHELPTFQPHSRFLLWSRKFIVIYGTLASSSTNLSNEYSLHHCESAVGAQFHPLRDKLVRDSFINENRLMPSLRQCPVTTADFIYGSWMFCQMLQSLSTKFSPAVIKNTCATCVDVHTLWYPGGHWLKR